MSMYMGDGSVDRLQIFLFPSRLLVFLFLSFVLFLDDRPKPCTTTPPALVHERRQSQAPSSTGSATAIVDAAPTYTSAVNVNVPTSTTALAVVVSILCVVSSLIIDFTSEKAKPFDVESKLDLKSTSMLPRTILKSPVL
ncbi:hypothetical protein B0H10DRAFT_2213934 [Mycena sp. CBHHK59/15]|nr:hypothetical protein B0H10DRAFT_2213934 [Mycena sp. CBHHK59/15]